MHLSKFMICQLASSQLKKNKKLFFLKIKGELPPPPPPPTIHWTFNLWESRAALARPRPLSPPPRAPY